MLGAGSLAGITFTLNRRFEKVLLTARFEVRALPAGCQLSAGTLERNLSIRVLF